MVPRLPKCMRIASVNGLFRLPTRKSRIATKRPRMGLAAAHRRALPDVLLSGTFE